MATTHSIKSNIVVVIIAIEKYRHADINQVHYAGNDAMAFQKLLREQFNVPIENITCWINENATKSFVEEELPYKIRQLTENDTFIFYYAGHGFHNSEGNRLTVWDSHKSNLTGTTVTVNQVLLEPLKSSACKQSMIFLDACADYISDTLVGRDMISSMSTKEFAEFGSSDKFHAIFHSCSEGQKSYPCEDLQHGVWTWHLIEALKGNKPEAIYKGIYITDQTLQNYLRVAVPKYITDKKITTRQQIPFATISSSNTIIIRTLPVLSKFVKSSSSDLKLQFQDLFLRRIDDKNPKDLIGFKKGHVAPRWISSTGNKFIQESAAKDIEEELHTVYENAKNILELKRRNIEKEISRGSGIVKTDYFKYELEVYQHSENPAIAVFKRTIVITSPLHQLSRKFNDIFPVHPDEVVIPIVESLDFNKLVELFEDLEEKKGGSLSEDDAKGRITYQTESQITFVIDIEAMELVIYPGFGLTPINMIENATNEIKGLSSGSFMLLDE
jgi:hypothetical protein